MSSVVTSPHPYARPISPLRGRVVVITGASSGIGRATARAFAAHGTRLVLTARNVEALQATARECAWRGAHSLVIPADVTDEHAMAELARKANDAFGRIDVWINNAGTGLFGPVENADAAAQRRVVEINLFGAMNGVAAVLPTFLRQGKGTIITNISLGGFAPVPFAAAYTAGKFGLRGYMAALRQELVPHRDIHVCSVFPAVIDTPGFEHAANVSDVELRPASPIFPPEKVADAMVSLALRPRAELPVGWPAYAARLGFGLAPRTTENVIGAIFRNYLSRSAPGPRSDGNLREPSRGRHTAHGGWRTSPRDPAAGKSLLWAGAIGGVATAFAWWATRGESRPAGPTRRANRRAARRSTSIAFASI